MNGDDGEALPQRTRRRRRARETASDSGSFCSSQTGVVDADHMATVQASVRPIPAAPSGNGYEYLDHTADVQLHSWGTSLPRAFEQAVIAMMAYMTDLELVEVCAERTFTAEGHDLKSLLYNFMNECLYVFCTELFVCKQVEVVCLELSSASSCDRQTESDGIDEPGIEQQSDASMCERSGASICERGRMRQHHSTEDGDASDVGSGSTSTGVSREKVWRIRARGVGERFEMGRHSQGTEIKAITYSAMQIFDRAPTTQAVVSSSSSTPSVGCTTDVGGMAAEHTAEIFVIVDI